MMSWSNGCFLKRSDEVIFISVRPRLQSREPVISELGHESVKLTWSPAELPYYSRNSTPITYTVEYQVNLPLYQFVDFDQFNRLTWNVFIKIMLLYVHNLLVSKWGMLQGAIYISIATLS